MEETYLDESRRYEKINVEIFRDAAAGARKAAQEIAELIRSRQARNQKCVLGLATGITPLGVYSELIRMHREEGLSFKNVVTFNLDEYYPIRPESAQSYHYFMHRNLFDHIDIPAHNIHIPRGDLKADQVKDYCRRYEKEITDAGGIDLQILGIGRTGHIGFNEPGSEIDSRTRMIHLDNLTISDAASEFAGKENVPSRAITMGVGTILAAKKIILLAWGENKAPVVKLAAEGKVSDQLPASFLQKHANALFIIDDAASAELTRVSAPWMVGDIRWTERLIRRAVLWLCQKVQKPILKLEQKDYNDNYLSGLLSLFQSANKINIQVFNDLQHTITGWPGGKPNADDTTRPERADPYPKRVLIFSPHPDDDVISMGGTFARLVEQGHEVHVAYQTSGNIAVADDYLVQLLDLSASFASAFSGADPAEYRELALSLGRDKKDGPENPEVLRLKGLIRRAEARAACRYIGVPEERIHFLDLPFYNTGTVKKNPLSEKDIDIVARILDDIKPHQVYAAGDLADPHGTHRVCWDAIEAALLRMKDRPWMKDCYVWWYRGAWQEWEIDKADMAVPISPSELMVKRIAILKHQSQKDMPLFPGADSREFWQRAEDRNRATADLYDKLGMAEYEAMEVFVRYRP